MPTQSLALKVAAAGCLEEHSEAPFKFASGAGSPLAHSNFAIALVYFSLA